MIVHNCYKYRLGKRVMILDFDYPEHNLSYMRRRDLGYLEREGIHYSDEDFYPIESIDKMRAEEHGPDDYRVHAVVLPYPE